MTLPNSDLNQQPDSIWHYKPWWCQPWSILLTGFSAIGGSWYFFHRYWLTGLVALPLLAWMGFFLLVFPRLARESGLLAELSQDPLQRPDTIQPAPNPKTGN